MDPHYTAAIFFAWFPTSSQGGSRKARVRVKHLILANHSTGFPSPLEENPNLLPGSTISTTWLWTSWPSTFWVPHSYQSSSPCWRFLTFSVVARELFLLCKSAQASLSCLCTTQLVTCQRPAFAKRPFLATLSEFGLFLQTLHVITPF